MLVKGPRTISNYLVHVQMLVELKKKKIMVNIFDTNTVTSQKDPIIFIIISLYIQGIN